MTFIPKLNCPTCGVDMIRKEENGQPIWYCFVEDCPCKYLEGHYEINEF